MVVEKTTLIGSEKGGSTTESEVVVGRRRWFSLHPFHISETSI